MPIVNPIPRVAEYQNFNIVVTASPTGNERIIGVKITGWTHNDGVIVDGNRISGEYKGAFIYAPNTLRIRKGNEYSYLTSWEDITEPTKTDVYYWKAPTHSVYYLYTVEVTYMIPPPETGGGSSRAVGGTSSTYTEIISHEVYPNWDVYANKLREQVATRRMTWQDGDEDIWQE